MSKSTDSSPTTQPTSTPSSLPHSPLFVSAYSPKIRSQLLFPEQGRTKQSFKDECDINNIMRRFQVTGQVDHLSQRSPMWGDVPEVDFQGAMALVVDARDRFNALPSDIRDRFSNDPARLIEFLRDPANKEEGIKLGLLNKPQAPATPPPPPPPVPPTGTPPATPPSAS